MSVLLIDGRSGAGKTTLAEGIAVTLQAQILHVEDLYPGWDGLAAGSASIAEALESGSYHRYDWLVGEFSETSVELDLSQPLVIEGCGALTLANLNAAKRWHERAALRGGVRSIWLSLEQGERRRRALARDGRVFAAHWDRWAKQERAFFGEHLPWLLADEVLEVGQSGAGG